MKIPFIYEIEFIPTGARYIGSRCISKPADLLVKYFTSSKVIKQLIREHGVDSFKIIKIIVCTTPTECIELENKLLKEISEEEKCKYLNINFSAGGSVIKSQTHQTITNGTEKIMIPRNFTVPDGWELIKPIPPSQKGKTVFICPETNEKLFLRKDDVIPEGFVELKKLTKEKYKSRVRRPQKDLIWITDGKANRKILGVEEIPFGWRRGKVRTTDAPYKINRDRPKTTLGTFAINDGIAVVYIPIGTAIPTGWSKGSVKLIWINNGVENIRLRATEEIPVGYIRGMK